MWAIWKWDLQCPGCQVNAGTGNAFWLEPHKDICSQAVVHVVPEKQESRRLQGTAKLFGVLDLALLLQGLFLSAFSY